MAGYHPLTSYLRTRDLGFMYTFDEFGAAKRVQSIFYVMLIGKIIK